MSTLKCKHDEWSENCLTVSFTLDKTEMNLCSQTSHSLFADKCKLYELWLKKLILTHSHTQHLTCPPN